MSASPKDPFDFGRYLERVGLTPADVDTSRSFEVLHRILWAQATHIPWENLSNVDPARRVLHPSSEARVHDAEHDVPAKLRTSLDPTDIFHKLVDRRRGGFCYEHNLLLARALREVGFDVRLVCARGVNRAVVVDERVGFAIAPTTHLVLVAYTADGSRYLVDDGFIWAGAPRTPLRLVHGDETHDADTGEIFRMVRAPARPAPRPGFERWGNVARTSGAPGVVDKDGAGSGSAWFLQYKPSADAPEYWDMFHFDESEETTLDDCATGAWYASSSPFHKQPHMRLAAIMTATGRIGLVNDVLTIRERGRVVSETRLATDGDVVAALERHFGIT
ncbi:MAG: arylamine N-acetyltransferase [Polyangiaceae bacterium]